MHCGSNIIIHLEFRDLMIEPSSGTHTGHQSHSRSNKNRYLGFFEGRNDLTSTNSHLNLFISLRPAPHIKPLTRAQTLDATSTTLSCKGCLHCPIRHNHCGLLIGQQWKACTASRLRIGRTSNWGGHRCSTNITRYTQSIRGLINRQRFVFITSSRRGTFQNVPCRGVGRTHGSNKISDCLFSSTYITGFRGNKTGSDEMALWSIRVPLRAKATLLVGRGPVRGAAGGLNGRSAEIDHWKANGLLTVGTGTSPDQSSNNAL